MRSVQFHNTGFAGKSPFEAAWLDALGDQYKDYNTEMSSYWGVAAGFAKGDKAQLEKDVAEPAINKFFSIMEKQAKVGDTVIDASSYSLLVLIVPIQHLACQICRGNHTHIRALTVSGQRIEWSFRR